MDAAEQLAGNLERVRARIASACARRGRDPSDVTLIAVTKTVPAALIQMATVLGVLDIGENHVQEARAKRDLLPHLPTRWHLIGRLQRNKAKEAVVLFDTIHSVDSLSLAEELQRQAAARRDRPLDVLVQVNVSGEASKSGCAPTEALPLARAIAQQPALRLAGLMTIPPLASPAEAARPHFRRLRQLRDEVAAALAREPESLPLSMGMSADFEVAVEEGAGFVRIGTALFGARA
jgi:pyridoxal phosphate enzyme (YggS family)